MRILSSCGNDACVSYNCGVQRRVSLFIYSPCLREVGTLSAIKTKHTWPYNSAEGNLLREREPKNSGVAEIELLRIIF